MLKVYTKQVKVTVKVHFNNLFMGNDRNFWKCIPQYDNSKYKSYRKAHFEWFLPFIYLNTIELLFIIKNQATFLLFLLH